MRITKEQKGITLIALVITIIVLLILAGVALATLSGNGSIIENANYAVGEYNKSANSDQNVLNSVEGLLAQYSEKDAKHKIVYNANGGTGTMGDEEASVAGTSTFTAPEGKIFKEWNTAADGSGTSYAAGASIPSDVTLYAIWVTEAIQQQYGNLVDEEHDTINQDLFLFTTQEPSVGLVRHTASDTDGVVSRGDTPSVQKGTATITGINWNYFKQTNPDDFEIASVQVTGDDEVGSTEYTFTVKTEAKKNEIANALRKLIIPYEVTKEVNGDVRTYTVTRIDVDLVKEIKFDVQENSGYQIPLLVAGTDSKYLGQTTTSSDTSYLIIPNSVTSVGNINLLPRDQILFASNSSVTQLEARFLVECKYTSVISLPAGFTSIGKKAFHLCKSLTNITIPNTVTTIEDAAFWMSGLTNVTIPGSVRTIKVNAFASCDNLTNVTMQNGVSKLEWGAFELNKNLTKIYIPASVTEIESYCFNIGYWQLTDNLPVETTIYYGGSMDQWNAITKGSAPFGGRNITVVPNSAGIPEE